MDQQAWVHKRKKRYMAQILEAFETDIEPHLGPEANGHAQDFKGLVRMRLNALAVDACEVMSLENEGVTINGAAQAARDSLHPTGRP